MIIPSWEQTLGWRALNESPFCAHHLRLAQRQHGYTEGAQHCRRSRYRISVGDTSVFFLQSKAARSKWPVSASSLSKLWALSCHSSTLHACCSRTCKWCLCASRSL